MPAKPTQRQRLLEYLDSQAPARARELAAVGVSAATISRALAAGEIIRHGRGLYALPDSPMSIHESLVHISKYAPRAVICLTSVLAFHDLTDQLPRSIWIAVGAKDRQPKITWPPVRTVRFREPYFSGDVEDHLLGSTHVRMYSITKSLADAFRNPRMVDRSVAIEALKSTLYEQHATPSEIAAAAGKFGAWKQMRPYLEAVVSNG